MKIEIIKEWKTEDGEYNWWFKKGEQYEVRKSSNKATKNGTLDYCYCSECAKERGNMELYKLFEVSEGKHEGSIIPIVVCKII